MNGVSESSYLSHQRRAQLLQEGKDFRHEFAGRYTTIDAAVQCRGDWFEQIPEYLYVQPTATTEKTDDSFEEISEEEFEEEMRLLIAQYDADNCDALEGDGDYVTNDDEQLYLYAQKQFLEDDDIDNKVASIVASVPSVVLKEMVDLLVQEGRSPLLSQYERPVHHECEEGSTWSHGGIVGSSILSVPEVLVGGMPPKKRLKGKKRVQGNKKPQNPMYGTMSRPPQPSMGTQIMTLKNSGPIKLEKQIRIRLTLATTGAQTLFGYTVYMYSPGQTTSFIAGTITASGIGLSATAVSLFTVFEYYKVKRVSLQYTHVVPSTTVVPPMYIAADADGAPADVTPGVITNLNEYENCVQVDSHHTTTVGYWVPPTTAVAYASASDNQLAGGWIPCDISRSTRATTDPGVIYIYSGETGGLVAPLTTTYGVVDIVWDVIFKMEI